MYFETGSSHKGFARYNATMKMMNRKIRSHGNRLLSIIVPAEGAIDTVRHFDSLSTGVKAVYW